MAVETENKKTICVDSVYVFALVMWVAKPLGLRPGMKIMAGIMNELRVDYNITMQMEGYTFTKLPSGFYSEKFEAWVGHLCTAGYAQVENDDYVNLNNDGIMVCGELIDELNTDRESLQYLTKTIFKILTEKSF